MSLLDFKHGNGMIRLILKGSLKGVRLSLDIQDPWDYHPRSVITNGLRNIDDNEDGYVLRNYQ